MSVYVNKDGQQYGPFTVEQLRMYVQQGNFTTADLACCDGQNWILMSEVPGFADGDDFVTTPQYPQAVQQQPASADASTSPPKKDKTILYVSMTLFGMYLVAKWVLKIFA